MSGSNKDLIRLNTGAMDGNLFMMGYSNSWFQYRAWEVISDKVRDVKRKTVTDNLSFGGEVSVEFDKVGTLLEDVKVDTTISAITPAGTGTYARFCDFLGLALYPNIYVTYASNSLQKYTSLSLFTKYMRDKNRKDGSLQEDQLAGSLTEAQRNTRATASQVVRTYIKPYWWKQAGHSVILTSLSNKLKITLGLANLNDVMQTDYDGVSTASITKVEFIYDVINLTGIEREQFAQRVFTDEGETYLFEETHTVLNYKIPAGNTDFKIPLNTMQIPFSTAYGFIQKYSAVSTTNQKKPFEFDLADYALVTETRLRESENSDFVVSYGLKDTADQYCKKNVSSCLYIPHFFYCVSEAADIKNANFGSFNAQNASDFHIYVKFASALAVDMAFSVVLFEHNWINHQRGELQRIFAV